MKAKIQHKSARHSSYASKYFFGYFKQNKINFLVFIRKKENFLETQGRAHRKKGKQIEVSKQNFK